MTGTIASKSRMRSVGSRNSRDFDSTQSVIAKYLLAIASVFVITGAYWFIEHSWDQSVISAWLDENEYSESRNDTADRLAKVNSNSTGARLGLALWGCFCFLLRGRVNVRWDSWLLRMSVVGWGLMCASLFWSIQPSLTLFKLLVMATVLIAVIGIVCSLSMRQLFFVLTGCCASFIVIGILAEVSMGTFHPWRNYRFIGTSHPNTLAAYGAFLCLASRLFFDQGSRRLFGVSLLILGVTAIYLTKSRTTLGGVAVAMLCTQILAAKPSNRILYLAAGGFLAGLIALATLFLGAESSGQLSKMARLNKGDDVSNMSGRLPLWEELISAIGDRPFFGYGYSAYWDPDRVETLSETFRWEIPHGHNCYLDILLDVGLLGFLVFLLWYGIALGTAVYHFIRTRRTEYAVVFGFMIFVTINAFAESLFKLPTYLTFMLLASTASLFFSREEASPSVSTKATQAPPRPTRLPSRRDRRGPQAQATNPSIEKS